MSVTKLDLQFGKSLDVGGITVKHPTVQDVISYGERNYGAAINIFTAKPSDIMVYLYDMGLDYTKVKPYEVFLLTCGEIPIQIERVGYSEIQMNIGWLTGIFDFELADDMEIPTLLSRSTNKRIDIAIYSEIRKYLMMMNFRDEKERYNPGNEATKKALVEEERRRMKRKSKRIATETIPSQISSLVWSSSGAVTYNTVGSLCIYQFYDGLYRMNRIKHYDEIMSAWSNGCMKNSDLDVIKDKIDWMA